MVHTCPRCELRFTTETEVVDHLTIDHGLRHEAFEHRYHYHESLDDLDQDARPRAAPAS